MVSRVIVVAVVILALGGLIAYSQFRPEPNKVSGFIEADEIRVGSRIGGRVQVVHVEEGERVTAGQLLIELEPYDLLEREKEAVNNLAALDAAYRKLKDGLRPEEVAQAKARYEQAQAQLDALQNGPRRQEIEAARGRLEAAAAEAALAKSEFERAQTAFDRGAITRADLDTLSQKMTSAEGMHQVRQEELALLEAGNREENIREAEARVDEAEQAWQLAQSGYRQEDVEQARAARDAAEAKLEVIREQKKELSIKSPVNGVIEAMDLLAGDLVPAGAPVLSIMDDSRLWVRAYIPENRVGLTVGQKLEVSVDSMGDERMLGEISFISRQAEFTPSNAQTPEERSKQVFRVKVTLEGDLKKLRPGMTADVWLEPAGESQ